MSSRFGLRFFQSSKAAFHNASSPLRRHILRNRRFQSTEATAEKQSFLQRSWNSPVGMKTVHFWAPVMKWVLVIAGLGDMARPADKLSLTQNLALMCTGAIWTRWCLIIKPKNVLLATVNFFVGCLGLTQVTRIFLHRRSVDGSSTGALKDLSHEATDSAKIMAHKAEDMVKKD
ncbi:hypothetical protein LOZ39_000553 [Ophidiomyces ophidiicola]|nr:hypothetical protein LOZ50_000076 [Ophidiomyces ophidiicola]KAI2015982.1 hypothetical protein LOZ49_000378 [Ophidiomyces ophidiicola]KAI2042209.1 hypothetical protein LOZ44_006288 [Ophidiomyces ophidiicola]KAI2080832.1 hypothetical protein LOZ39_000553 [Ophidiomyces ophidiicola]KAI2144231.1 hypothetical protein LOZ28_001473 [Ophidiomyces ophidiicola]